MVNKKYDRTKEKHKQIKKKTNTGEDRYKHNCIYTYNISHIQSINP